jgi:hypothetical protein
MWRGPLSDCAEPTRKTLRLLLTCPEAFRPFVIVEGVPFEDGPFVQFAGSTERGLELVFLGQDRCARPDMSALGIVAVPYSTPEEGASQVLALLRKQGVREDDEVRVRFESTGPQSASAARASEVAARRRRRASCSSAVAGGADT